MNSNKDISKGAWVHLSSKKVDIDLYKKVSSFLIGIKGIEGFAIVYKKERFYSLKNHLWLIIISNSNFITKTFLDEKILEFTTQEKEVLDLTVLSNSKENIEFIEVLENRGVNFESIDN